MGGPITVSTFASCPSGTNAMFAVGVAPGLLRLEPPPIASSPPPAEGPLALPIPMPPPVAASIVAPGTALESKPVAAGGFDIETARSPEMP
ncbi:MAG: hypothetical protein U0165_16865 [Polyangiaceae bacterium]